MKFAEINRRYTEAVAEWLAKGYTINTATMSGTQGEFAKIDLTDGKEIIRVVVAAYVKKLRDLPTKIAKLVNPHDIDLAEGVLTEECEKIIASMKRDMEKKLQRDIEAVDEEEPIQETEQETEDAGEDYTEDE
jgi:uncharacterized protein YeeX (DUF496 family)